MMRETNPAFVTWPGTGSPGQLGFTRPDVRNEEMLDICFTCTPSLVSLLRLDHDWAYCVYPFLLYAFQKQFILRVAPICLCYA